MHNTIIPERIRARVIDRRGRAHAFADMNPERTAHLVVDLQRGFMDPAVAHSFCPAALEIVPAVNELSRALRETGGQVIYIRMVTTDESLSAWSVYHEDLCTEAGRKKRLAHMRPGGAGTELWPELEIGPDDLVVDKTHFSAFIEGSSSIESVLRERGLDTVLITGTVTNVCCESTARDAMMRNFRTVMIADGCAARCDEDHNAALTNFYSSFGDVMTAAEAAGYLRANAKAEKASATGASAGAAASGA